MDAVQFDRLAHQRGIEPAAAALTYGHHAEFTALLAEPLADAVDQLGGERPLADARGIGLEDAENVTERPRTAAGARWGPARQGVRRCVIRISTSGEVEQR